MSYILDALRRADAERERGEVPGLQSQQHAMLDDEEGRPRSRALLWAVVVLTLALAGAIGWNFIGGEPPRPTPVAEAPRPAVVAVAPAPLPVPAAATPAASAPVVAAARVGTPASAAAATARAEALADARAEARAVARAELRAARSAAALPSSTAPTALASAPRPAADNRIYAQAELPDNIRRELPRVTIGGASYSGDKASRMVIINGQVFHEGDAIANGLVLQQIKLKAAVLAYKGWRYQIDF